MDDPVILASGHVSHKLLPLLPAHQMNYPVFSTGCFNCVLHNSCPAKNANGSKASKVLYSPIVNL
jgi:hypothetical protein